MSYNERVATNAEILFYKRISIYNGNTQEIKDRETLAGGILYAMKIMIYI